MNKFFIVLLVALVVATSGYSQRRGPEKREAKERIHAAKMVYITDRLNLSAEQTAGFMPVYKEYEDDMKNTRKTFMQKYKGMDMDNADESTSMQYVDDNLDYQQKVIELKRKYNDRFLKVITAQQIADLNKAEREFKQILMRRLEQRGGQRRGGGKWR